MDVLASAIVVDTMPAYYRSWQLLCEKYGLSLSEERFYQMAGIPVKDMIKTIIDESGKRLDVEELFEEKCKFGEQAVKEIGTPAIAVVVEVSLIRFDFLFNTNKGDVTCHNPYAFF